MKERKPTATGQLVSIKPLPEVNEVMCQWVPASVGETLMAALQREQQAESSGGPDEALRAELARRQPVRMIRDPYAAFAAVAVDTVRNEVVMSDQALFQLLVYDRKANTPPTAAMTEPKRVIGGIPTNVEFQCGFVFGSRTRGHSLV